MYRRNLVAIVSLVLTASLFAGCSDSKSSGKAVSSSAEQSRNAASAVTGGAGSGSVAGTAKRDQTPLAGVTVQLKGTDDTSFEQRAQTDPQGHFEFKRVPPGKYALAVAIQVEGRSCSAGDPGLAVGVGEHKTRDITLPTELPQTGPGQVRLVRGVFITC